MAQLALDFEAYRDCTACGARYWFTDRCWPDACCDHCRMVALELIPPWTDPDCYRELRASGEYDRQRAVMLRGMPAARLEQIPVEARWWLA